MATKVVVSTNETPSVSPEFVPAPVLLTVKQAAAYLGATVSAIRNLIWDEDLRVVPVGQRYMIRVSDLDAWVRQNALLASDLDGWKKAKAKIRAPRRSESKNDAVRGKSRGKTDAVGQ